MLLNEVFSAIKKHCTNVNLAGGDDVIEGIKGDLKIANNPLEVYLQILQNMNLIDFSLGDSNHYILLTDLGSRLNEVPDSMPSIIL